MMVFCYQFKVFVLIYVKGIPVLYCVCVYIYICGYCYRVLSCCSCTIKNCEMTIQRSASILDN